MVLFRKYILLFLFGFLFAGLGILGYFSANLNEGFLTYFYGSDLNIEPYINSFRNRHRALMEVNFSALYGGSGQYQVLHPMLDVKNLQFRIPTPSCLPSGRDTEKSEISATFIGDENILPLEGNTREGSLRNNSNHNDQSKRELLFRFLTEGVRPPDNFITRSPFVDSSGYSFAFQLSQSEISPYAQKEWVQQHLSFFKISELSETLKKFNIDSPHYHFISKLNDSEIAEVVRGTPIILTKEYLLYKNQFRFGFSPLSYWIYDISDLREYLVKSNLELVHYSADSICLKQYGSFCWTFSSKHVIGFLYKYSIAVLITVGFIVLCLFGIYLRSVDEKTREQKKHQLSLQVLSHEFRTPVSSMIFLIEELLQIQNNLNWVEQDLITRLSGEVFRLQRIIEVSKTYLQAEGRKIQFNNVGIPSINNWIADFINEFKFKIKFEELVIDQSAIADPFWLKFVLSNLLQNAFAHGREPVVLRLKRITRGVQIVVEDCGDCEFSSLNQMSEAFVKSQRSTGMGLGLNMSQFIVKEWGSEILFSKNPTTFILSLVDRKAQI